VWLCAYLQPADSRVGNIDHDAPEDVGVVRAPQRVLQTLEWEPGADDRLDPAQPDELHRPGDLGAGGVAGSRDDQLLQQQTLGIDPQLGPRRIGREHNIRTVQATALIASGRIAALNGDRAQALARFQEAGVVAESGSDHYSTLTAMLAQTYTLIGSGDYAQTIAIAGKALAIAHRVGQIRSRGVDLATVLARALWLLGRWAQARAVIEDALAEEPPRTMAGALFNQLGEVALAQGDLATARIASARSRSLLVGETGTLPLFAVPFECRLALARGDLGAADQILVAALADPGLRGLVGDPWAVMRAGVQVQRALRDATGRDERRKQLQELAHDLSGFDPVASAHRATFEAEIDGADLAAWDAAVAAWPGLSMPFELAQALFGAAEASLAAGARAIAELLAARGRIDLTAQQPAPSQSEDRFGLTTRELDMLRLLTEGMSNRELAAALFISPSTAGVHVSRILAKLGVSRRTEAAAVAHRSGLFDPPDGHVRPISAES
jgi:DNA-binding CsgD family transcriptional regulator